MSDEEFLNLKNFISNLMTETIEVSNQSKKLLEEINSIDYQVSLLKHKVISLKNEVYNNEFKN